jgi:hypothetical protein
MKTVIAVFIFLASFQINAQSSEVFYQKDKTKITVKLLENFKKLEIKTSKNSKTQVIDCLEASITDKKSTISIQDYNFDGYKDIGVWHMDDGMGTYTFWEIFIYNPVTKQLKSLKFDPMAEFLCELNDILIDKKHKTIISKCFENGILNTEVLRFNKKGELTSLKK